MSTLLWCVGLGLVGWFVGGWAGKVSGKIYGKHKGRQIVRRMLVEEVLRNHPHLARKDVERMAAKRKI